MRIHRWTAAAIAAAALALATAAATAGATTMTLEPGGSFRSPALGRVTFTAGSITITCNLTFDGTLARSFTATAGAHMGAITTFEWGTCEGGDFRSVNNLPWEIQFASLTASGIEATVKHMSETYTAIILGILVECTYSGDWPILIEVAAGRTRLWTILANSVSKVSGAAACPEHGSYSGTFGLSPAQTVALA